MIRVDLPDRHAAALFGRMSVADLAAFGAALLVMLVGLLGSVLPGIPGPPLILGAAVLHRVIRPDSGPSTWVLVVLGLLTLFSFGIDFLATSLGAKRLGATWRGAVGAAIGTLLGFFWLPVGLVLGPLAGAMLLEMAGGRPWREAGRAGLGAMLGIAAGAIGKLGCSMAMIALFSVNLLLRWVG